jgi:TPR repeat protein
MNNLGCIASKGGHGVEQDDALAVAWWEKAAVGGQASAQFAIGEGYRFGKYGLPKSAHCAKIYKMAASATGHVEAIEDLKELRVRRSRRQPRVPGLHVRDGHQHGPLLQPQVPGGALEGTQGRLRRPPGLRVPPLQDRPRRLSGRGGMTA